MPLLVKRVVVGLATISVSLGAWACGGDSKTPLPTTTSSSTSTLASTTSTTAPSTTSTTTAVATPSTAAPKEADHWIVVEATIGDNGSGKWGGTARIRNDGKATRSSGFVFTVMRDGRAAATLHASAEGVAKGQVVDLKLETDDAFSPGAFDYTFATEFGF